MEHAKEGLFVMWEEPLGLLAIIGRRRVLLWDVAPRELQIARGHIEFDVERRVLAKELAGLRVHLDGNRSRVEAELRSGERVDLIGARSQKEVDYTVQAVILASGTAVLDG
jgi:hypothetical protein